MPGLNVFTMGPTQEALASEKMGQGLGLLGGYYGRRNQLKSAFENVKKITTPEEGKEPATFLDIMEQLAPDLMMSPQGSKLLGQLAPILQKGVSNRIIAEGINKLDQQNKDLKVTGAKAKTPEDIEDLKKEKSPVEKVPGTTMQVKTKAQTGEEAYRKGEKPETEETLFPQRNVIPKKQAPMTPEEMKLGATNLMKETEFTANPLDFPSAMAVMDKLNDNINKNNAAIDADQAKIQQAQSQFASDMITRAEELYSLEPNDKNVIEKFSWDARNAENPNEVWNYTKKMYDRYVNKREGIRRVADLAGPFGNLWRKYKGTYQELPEIQKAVGPSVDWYKEHGLINELRSEISSSIGTGPEQTEETIFPFSGNQIKQIENFPRNPLNTKAIKNFEKQKRSQFPSLANSLYNMMSEIRESFPGDAYRLDEPQFIKFKDEIAQFLNSEENKGINLVSFKGRLNQEKEYAWQDISRAISENLNDGRINLDYVQQEQLNIINNPPMPGLFQQFQYIFKGRK